MQESITLRWRRRLVPVAVAVAVAAGPLGAPGTTAAQSGIAATATTPDGTDAGDGGSQAHDDQQHDERRHDGQQFVAAADTARIIPVTGDLAEVVFALGFGDRVVATDISATYPPAADATPKIGYQRTLKAETLLEHMPTLVITDDRAGPPEVFELLSSADVEVALIPHHTDIDAPAYKIRAVAATLDAVAAGEELVAEFEAQLAAAEAMIADSTERPTVMALYLRGTAVQLVFGDDSGIDAVIEAAGGADAGTALGIAGAGELSTEAIVVAAPDYFLVTTSGLASVGGIDGLLRVPGLAETPAGENRAVLVFDDQYLYGLGPRTGQLVLDLATAFHTLDTDDTDTDTTHSDDD